MPSGVPAKRVAPVCAATRCDRRDFPMGGANCTIASYREMSLRLVVEPRPSRKARRRVVPAAVINARFLDVVAECIENRISLGGKPDFGRTDQRPFVDQRIASMGRLVGAAPPYIQRLPEIHRPPQRRWCDICIGRTAGDQALIRAACASRSRAVNRRGARTTTTRGTQYLVHSRHNRRSLRHFSSPCHTSFSTVLRGERASADVHIQTIPDSTAGQNGRASQQNLAKYQRCYPRLHFSVHLFTALEAVHSP